MFKSFVPIHINTAVAAAMLDRQTAFGSLAWLVALVLAMMNIAQGATYYVSSQSSTSSDDGLGTKAAPFNTITKAASIATAGDTVCVGPGVYPEDVRLSKSGRPGRPIRFLAVPPGEARIIGADPLRGWTRVPGTTSVYQVAWNHIFAIDWANGVPIEYHPGNAPLWGRAEQVICDQAQLLPVASASELFTKFTNLSLGEKILDPVPPLGPAFTGWFTVDTSAKLLYVCLADGSDPSDHSMLASTRSETFGTNQWVNPAGVQWIDVSGFVFEYGASFPQRSVVDLYGKNNSLTNCIIESMAGSGVAVNGKMVGCVVRDCGQTGGGPVGDGFEALDDIWYDNDWKPIDRGWDGGGDKIVVANGGEYRNCLFEHNGGPGLWYDIDMHNTHITKCVFKDNESAGFFNEISRGNRIDHSLFVGNAIFPSGDPGWNAGGLCFGESQDCTILNNTIVGNRNGISIREQGPRPTTSEDGMVIRYFNRNLVFKNNICAFNRGYQLQLMWDNGYFGRHPSDDAKYTTEAAYDDYLLTVPELVFNPAQQNLVFDSNLYFAAPTEKLVLYGVDWRPKHKVFSNLTEWNEVGGWDAQSVVADPQFVNYANADYRLGKKSPGIRLDAGWRDVPASIGTWKSQLVQPWQIPYLSP